MPRPKQGCIAEAVSSRSHPCAVLITSSWGGVFDIFQNSRSLPCLSCFLPRPLWVHYPQDVTTFSIDDQFLLGEKRGGQLVVGRFGAEK